MPEAAADLRRLRNRARTVYNKAESMLDLICEHADEIGYALTGEWEGCRAVHFADDKYRIVWEVDDDRGLVIALRVAQRFPRGRSLYDWPRPSS